MVARRLLGFFAKQVSGFVLPHRARFRSKTNADGQVNTHSKSMISIDPQPEVPKWNLKFSISFPPNLNMKEWLRR
jgi:hypothetical protein